MSRQRTFLGQDIWKTVPWEDGTSTKQSIDYLVDLMTDVPELLEMATSKPGQQVDLFQPQGKTELLIRISRLLEKLDVWRISWERIHPDSYFETTDSRRFDTDGREPTNFLVIDKSDAYVSSFQPAPTTSLLADSPFPASFQFSGLWRAYELCLYSGTRIIALELYITLIGLHGQAEASFSKHSNWQPDLIALDRQINALATDICRSMYYLCIEAQDPLHTVLVIFAARLAYNSLDRGSQESLWLGRIIETFASARGFAIGGIITQDSFHKPNNMQKRRLKKAQASNASNGCLSTMASHTPPDRRCAQGS